MLLNIKPKILNTLTILAYAVLVFSAENYIRHCPYCRDGMVWERRYLYPGLRQAPNEEPLISHPCRRSNVHPLMTGCNFSCLEVEFVPNGTGEVYYYRDCSERLLVEGPCDQCDHELAENYSYVNTNKSVAAYDLFTPSPIAIKVILVVLGTILLLFTVKVLCSSLTFRWRMRIPTNALPVRGQVPENQPSDIEEAPTSPKVADTKRTLAPLKRPRVSFSTPNARKIVRYHKEGDGESVEAAGGNNDTAEEVSETQDTDNPENDFTPTTFPCRQCLGFKRLRTDYVWHVPRYFKFGANRRTARSPRIPGNASVASSSTSSNDVKTCYPGSVSANSPSSSFLSPSGQGTLPEASTADSSDAVPTDPLKTRPTASTTADSPHSSFVSATGRSTLPESTTADSSDVASTDPLKTSFPKSITANSPGSSFLSPSGRSNLPESTTADSPDFLSNEMRTRWPRSVTGSSPLASFLSPHSQKSPKSEESPQVVSTTDDVKTRCGSVNADSPNVVSTGGLNICSNGSVTANSPSSILVFSVDENTNPVSKSLDSCNLPVCASVGSSSSGWSHGYVPPPLDLTRCTLAISHSDSEEDWFADQDTNRDRRSNQELSTPNARAESAPLLPNREETENTETEWNPFSMEGSEDTDQRTGASHLESTEPNSSISNVIAESNPLISSEEERIARKEK
ncbi:hypothetical protein ANCCAN_02836 [Ancylostoma caninum]|uniref:Uncharacterized protein n=1 Tax=Ancylostoma caninum TaxID=29170 RepID=A0A368H5Y3_ANCCA|nr:hypothetical protein ANCCAN_02836 [Ancylostoma caninum]